MQQHSFRSQTLLVLLLLLVFLSAACLPSDYFFTGRTHGGQGSRGADDSLYNMLDLDRSASAQDITKAYRRKAMTTHPDKGGSEEEFKKLNEAYEVLSNDERRATYDRFGLAGINGRQTSPPNNPAADLARELFRGFGGAAGFGGGFSMPVVYQLDLSLEDFFKGRRLEVPLSSIKVAVDIKPGMMAGQELILRAGQTYEEGRIQRDVIFRLAETRHSTFQRRNADLLLDLTISLTESLLGFERTITHLDGKPINLSFGKNGDCLSSGDVLVVPAQGMPVFQSPKTRGRLFVRVKVDIPKKLWIHNKEDLVELERLLESGNGSKKKQKGKNKVHPSWGETTEEGKEEGGEEEEGGKKKRKKNSSSMTLIRGDLSSFGAFGQHVEEDEDEVGGNPFAQFWFR